MHGSEARVSVEDMRRASRKNGMEVPPSAFDVVCVHNGRNQQCFSRDERKAHPECIQFICSVCGTDYTGADTHEPDLGWEVEPNCLHITAVDKHAQSIKVDEELTDLDLIEAELRTL